MRDVPTGTVTFLFTDIEGSTRLLSELGESYSGVLAEHHRIVREAVERHGGVEVDTQGDGFFISFARASDGVAAAGDAQAALAAVPVRVRMGLHTGEPKITEEGYVGIDVHRAARIGNAANGGQVVISPTTRELLGDDVELRDLGEHRLKDFPAATRLFQLGTAEFPPLRTPDEAKLPAAPTPMIGRKKELRDALRLLLEDRVRLLTITGPGGVGKTRFAIEAASESLGSFTDGARFADLAPLQSADGVVPAIAQSIRAPGSLVEALKRQEVLLVLDNAEHVAAAAPALGSLLDSCPGVSMLVTSREPLHLSLERELPLRPMPEAPAVELFRQRGQMADPDFEGDYPVLADICGRLDGLPLAIELAASRVKTLGVEGLRERLDQRLPLLTARSRDVPERQRTLRATIEWSYDLLDEPEQFVLTALAVFVGGCTVEAAEAVTGADIDALESLVEKSLVRQKAGRLSMLETVREYALERLGADEEAEATIRQRHAEHYLTVAEPLSSIKGHWPSDALEPFWADYENLLAGLGWFRERGDPRSQLRTALGLRPLWDERGPWREALRHTEEALAVYQHLDALRAWGLFSASSFAWRVGAAQDGLPLALEAVALARQIDDSELLMDALMMVGINAGILGAKEVSRCHYEEAEELVRAAGDSRRLANILNNLGTHALEVFDLETARRHLGEAVEIDRSHGFHNSLANSLVDLGFIALAEGRDADAYSHFGESLEIAVERALRDTLAWALLGFAAMGLAREHFSDAAKLLGSAMALQEALGVGDYYATGGKYKEQVAAVARESLGDAVYEDAVRTGRALSQEEAVQLARATLAEDG